MRIIFLLFLHSIFISDLFAESLIRIDNVLVNCSPVNICHKRLKQLHELKGEYETLDLLESKLFLLVNSGGFERFQYTINDKNELNISYNEKNIIHEVIINSTKSDLDLSILNMFQKEGDYIYEDLELKSYKYIK